MNQPGFLSPNRTPAASSFEGWLNGVRTADSFRVIGTDFDGTLVPKCANDSDVFRFVRDRSSPAIQAIFGAPSVVGGVVSARSFGEVRRILEDAFPEGGQRAGFSASEHGAVIFCPKLSPTGEEKLAEAGFQVLSPSDAHTTRYTVVKLARVSESELRDNIIVPVMLKAGIAADRWASSATHNTFRGDLEHLQRLNRHDNFEDTLRSVERFGSAYVKILGGPGIDTLTQQLVERANAVGVYSIVTQPHATDPEGVVTVDFSAGTDKRTALGAMSRAYATLLSRREDTFAFAYFGDAENDRVAFEYVLARADGSRAFLVDKPDSSGAMGGNRGLARDLPGVSYLEGRANISGVLAGARELSEIPPHRFRDPSIESLEE